MHESEDYYMQQVAQARLNRWSSGRVTVVGDEPLPDPTRSHSLNSVTKESHPDPNLVHWLYESLCLRFSMFIWIALMLLNTVSRGQLIAPPQALPSNSSVSSNAFKTYIIYSFVSGPSPASKNEQIRLHLDMMLPVADLQEYGGVYTGVEFWRAKMNDMQYTAIISAFPTVGQKCIKESLRMKVNVNSEKAQILENTQFLYHEDLSLSQNRKDNISDHVQSLAVTSNGTDAEIDLDAEIIYQRDAPSDLKMVSWAPGHPSGKFTSYAYDPEGGGQATIYLIENGIDGRNRVILNGYPTS